jgi:hypothetical protein
MKDTQQIMKRRDIFKDIFSLAVRILGLVFLCLGLKDVPAVLDVPTILNGDKVEILSTLLPVVFNLAVGWWLIGGGLLIRRAYPEVYEHSNAQVERREPASRPFQPQESADMDTAERRLAALVGKPRDNSPIA